MTITFPDDWFQGLPVPCPFQCETCDPRQTAITMRSEVLSEADTGGDIPAPISAYWVNVECENGYLEGPRAMSAPKAITLWNTRHESEGPWLSKPTHPGIWFGGRQSEKSRICEVYRWDRALYADPGIPHYPSTWVGSEEYAEWRWRFTGLYDWLIVPEDA